ncbi:YigZ family protein [Candidatus Gracilibacteria bacterium]|nr:YigZ family protein [Candidatus Gracilibacteria bacterium]
MVFQEGQFSLGFEDSFTPNKVKEIFKEIIIDRKSKYTVILLKVDSFEAVKGAIKDIQSDHYFKKASHNSYSYRIKEENGSILEGKNDDGEQGAGLCILRELQRVNAQNTMLVVTRFYGGIQLHNDRFKNVINAAKIVLPDEEAH